MLQSEMQPAARPSFHLATAGAVLIGTLLTALAVGALIGWFAGSIGIGLLVGAVVGIPAAVFAVYRRFRSAFL